MHHDLHHAVTQRMDVPLDDFQPFQLFPARAGGFDVNCVHVVKFYKRLQKSLFNLNKNKPSTVRFLPILRRFSRKVIAFY
jgi:hypothetical protein